VRIRTCVSEPRVARVHKSLGNAPPDVTPLDFCLWICKKSKIDGIKVDTRDELLACIFDAASVYCLCVNVSYTTATGCQPNCS
jgi:hypothetical protein